MYIYMIYKLEPYFCNCFRIYIYTRAVDCPFQQLEFGHYSAASLICVCFIGGQLWSKQGIRIPRFGRPKQLKLNRCFLD